MLYSCQFQKEIVASENRFGSFLEKFWFVHTSLPRVPCFCLILAACVKKTDDLICSEFERPFISVCVA